MRYENVREFSDVLKEISSILDAYSYMYALIPAELTFSLRHILSAFIHSFRSLRRGSKVRDPNIEFLRYYFGAKQIRDIKETLRRIASREFVCIAYGDGKRVVEELRRHVSGGHVLEDIIGGNYDVKRLSKVFNVNITAFDRGEGEIKALELGVLERVASLDIRK